MWWTALDGSSLGLGNLQEGGGGDGITGVIPMTLARNSLERQFWDPKALGHFTKFLELEPSVRPPWVLWWGLKGWSPFALHHHFEATTAGSLSALNMQVTPLHLGGNNVVFWAVWEIPKVEALRGV